MVLTQRHVVFAKVLGRVLGTGESHIGMLNLSGLKYEGSSELNCQKSSNENVKKRFCS